jgi:hypothetical protein
MMPVGALCLFVQCAYHDLSKSNRTRILTLFLKKYEKACGFSSSLSYHTTIIFTFFSSEDFHEAETPHQQARRKNQ